MKTHRKITALAGFSLLLVMIVAGFSLGNVRSAFPTLIAILLVSTVLLLVFAYVIHRSISVRLNKLMEGACEFSRGNLDYRLRVEGEDEISLLAEQMNGMADSLKHSIREHENKLSESTVALTAIERMEIVVRHEINNPLTTVIGNVELLIERYEHSDPELTARLEVILKNALKIAEITRRLQEIKKGEIVGHPTSIKITD